MKPPHRVAERRLFARIVESLSFKIGHEKYETEAVTLNISRSGALCLVDQDIPVMTKLRVGVTLPSVGKKSGRRKIIRATGVVVRRTVDHETGKFLIAVYFSDMKSQDSKVLKEYIDSRLYR